MLQYIAMDSPLIDEKTVEHIARLARIELGEEEHKLLLHDLQNILKFVSEFQKIDTTHVPPMDGGSALVNAFREDTERENTNHGEGKDAFPETYNGYLRVPPVFEA